MPPLPQLSSALAWKDPAKLLEGKEQLTSGIPLETAQGGTPSLAISFFSKTIKSVENDLFLVHS